ncbi:putative LRR receptor-like serine/threonine-protein kinase, partial [Mucuna pruriens]
MELVDPKMDLNFNKREVISIMNVALLCTNVTASFRLTMFSIVSMRECRSVVQDVVLEPSETLDERKLEAMRRHGQEIEENKLSEVQNQSLLVDDTLVASSTSTTNLYPSPL